MSRLAPFVPNLTLRLGRTEGNVYQSLEASLLSADISGFTALSERLADKGAVGAEELTDLINASFKALVDTAYGFGGEVLSFGGDAVLVVFPGDNHEQRAADAAIAMQRALAEHDESRDAGLTMTVGVGRGPFDVFLVGTHQRELLLTGRAATRVIELEGAAASGQILASAELAAIIDPKQVGEAHAEFDAVVISGEPITTPQPVTDRPIDVDVDVDLAPFVPADIVEELAAFERLGGEHRQMAITFLTIRNVGGVIEDEGPHAVLDHFGRLVDELVRICDEHGVCVYESDIYVGGIKFLLCAGAPVNRGEPLDAALSCALGIQAITTPFDLHLGVHSGRAFGGFLGTDYRRTYTAMGDVANTAARLMSKSKPGEIVAMRETVRNARTVFITEELEPFPAKGKSELIHADLVLAKADQVKRRGSARLVGRDDELAILAEALEQRSAVVELVGPGGVGKSAILDEFRLTVDGGERVVFAGACTPYGTATPYSLFRSALRSGLDISVDADPATAGQLLEKLVFQHAQHLLGSVPLLALAAGAEVAANDAFDAIDSGFVGEAVADAVIDLLDALFAEPVVIVLEDLHWVDDASAALVDQLIRQGADRPWTVVTTRRPASRWTLDPDEPHGESVVVYGLTDDDVRKLCLENADDDLTDAELEVVIERAEGNPLCAIEFVRAVRRTGLDALPDSIELLFAHRIDDLDADARLYLRTAAVLGIEFDRDELDVVTAEEFPGVDPNDVAHDGILENYGDGRLGFAHGLYRDAAYEGLPYRRRREVHQTIGEFLELDEARRSERLPLLSLHFDASGVWEKSWTYSLDAAAAAEASGANQAAADAYERALEAADRLGTFDQHRVVSVAISRGDCFSVLSKFDDAAAVYLRATQLGPNDVQALAIANRQAQLMLDQGDFDGAYERFNTAASSVAPTLDSDALIAGRSKALVGAAGAEARRGNHERTIELAREALVDANRCGDAEARAQALDRLHIGLVYARQPDENGLGRQALEAYRALGQHHRAGAVLNNLGIQAYFEGRWDDAAAAYRESAAEGERAGSVMFGQIGLLNAAEIRSDQGHWEEALADLQEVRRNWAAARYETGVAAADLFAGTAYLRAAQWSQATQRLRAAEGVLRRLGVDDLIGDVETRLLELDCYRGRPDIDACRAYLDALSASSPLRARVERAQALATAASGAIEEAIASLHRAVAAASSSYEEALGLDLLARVAPNDPSAASWRARADEIFGELDVVAVPAPPTMREARAPRRERSDPRSTQRRERRRR